MPKLLSLSLSILVLATFPVVSVSYAQENAASREAKVEERKVVIEVRREELKAKFEARKASFEARLAGIKDKNKARLLENLNNRYPVINQRWTTHFNSVLDRLEEVLIKVASHGVDTTLAQASIKSARVVVDNQSLKTYVITITDENNLKKDAQVIHRQLRSDLKIARDAVNSAREAVKAARAMVKQTQEKPVEPIEPINETIE